MIPHKPAIDSAAQSKLGRNSAPSLVRYPVEDGYRPWFVFVVILISIAATAALLLAQQAKAQPPPQQYQIFNLPSLGGTSSGGNSINDGTWVDGYSRLTGNQSRHAALWHNGSILDLGTLGGPNSSVTWNVKNTVGLIVGISQTATPEPLHENWSSAAFYGGPNNTGYIN